MKNYNEVLHGELNEDGVTRHEELGVLTDLITDLANQGIYFQSMVNDGCTAEDALLEGITNISEELNRLYQELK